LWDAWVISFIGVVAEERINERCVEHGELRRMLLLVLLLLVLLLVLLTSHH
jgi:hypothetical protein